MPPTSRSPLKILLQTVGTGGPNHPVWEALAYAFSQIQPTVLVQLCSEKTRRETVPRFAELVGDLKHVDHRLLTCGNHDDVESLTTEFSQVIEGLLEEFPKAELHMDFTSGTKPMSAAAVAVAISCKLPYLHYLTGPRDETGRATATTSQQTLDTGPLVAARLLDELGHLFNLGQFVSVHEQAQTLNSILTDQRLKARAESLSFLANAYGTWDRFDWKCAAAELRQVRNIELKSGSFSSAGWDLDALERQHQHVQRCKTHAPTPERQADLLANIYRRIAAGQFDDAVSRLYRLTELLLQERFFALVRKRQGNQENPTKGVPRQLIEEVAPETCKKLTDRKRNSSKWDLGVSDTMEVLAETNDPVARQMWHDYTGGTGQYNPQTNGPFCQRLDYRNNSWLAHGTRSVDPQIATELKNDLEKYLRLHFDHPTDDQVEHLQTFDELLAQARFSRCPWVDER